MSQAEQKVDKDEKIDKEAAAAIVEFVKSQVSRSDVPNVEAELKKDFVLAKRKSKGQLKHQRTRKKKKNLSKKEKKELGFYSLPRDGVKYEDVLPMNVIWLEYISNMLELSSKPIPGPSSKEWENFTQTLYKADFHGANFEVVRSRCPSYVGKMGICVMDTKNTFKLVSKENLITTIPKKDSVFDIHINDIRVQIFGKHLCVRPAERSTKKIKNHGHPDL